MGNAVSHVFPGVGTSQSSLPIKHPPSIAVCPSPPTSTPPASVSKSPPISTHPALIGVQSPASTTPPPPTQQVGRPSAVYWMSRSGSYSTPLTKSLGSPQMWPPPTRGGEDQPANGYDSW